LKIRKKHIWFILLIVLLLVVARYLLFSFSLNGLKSPLIDELEWVTDMKITIDGDIQGRLLPSFAVVAKDIELDYEGILNIKAKRLELEMPLVSVFSSDVLLRGIRIKDPEVVWRVEEYDSSIPDPHSAGGSSDEQLQDTVSWGVDLVDARITNGTFRYFDENYRDTVICTGIYVTSDSITFEGDADTLRFEDVLAYGDLIVKHARINSLLMNNVDLEVHIDDGVLDVSHQSEAQKGLIRIDLSGTEAEYYIHQDFDTFNIASVLSSYEEEPSMKGYMDFSLDVKFRGNTANDLWHNSEGEMVLKGSDLVLYGLDLDVVAKQYQRSQKFTLVDMSAVFLVGPVGIAVTKGGDYANLLISNKGDSTIVHNFISHWELNSGILSTRDVAFSTNKNRIAVHGSVNLWHQQFNEIDFALVNQYGCAVFQQKITGRFTDPQVSNVKVVKTLIGPLKNIFRGKKCKNPFYTGSVEPFGVEPK
jgi:AsmA protein